MNPTGTTSPKLDAPLDDVLIHSLLHRLLAAFHRPAAWSAAAVLLGAIPLLAPVGAVWWLLLGDGRAAAQAVALLALFFAADALLFYLLPHRGLSFGPWKAHFFVLALPRVVVALLSAFIGRWLGPAAALSATLLLQLAGSAALAWGTLVEPFRLALTHLDLRTDRWPAGRPPLRILHVSDLHVERLTRREARLLNLARHARPDLILITGDYLNLSYTEDPVAQAEVRRLLVQFSAPLGVFATLGSPPVDLRHVAPHLFDGLPIRLLRHEVATLDAGDGRRLALLGLDCTHHLPTDRRRLAELAARAPAALPQLLLYHAPDLMPEAAGHGLDLYLCGHTHGGQVRLPWYGAIITSSQLGKRFEMGHYQHRRTHLYVSRGVGFEGLSAPRLRFLAPPEITLITLGGNG